MIQLAQPRVDKVPVDPCTGQHLRSLGGHQCVSRIALSEEPIRGGINLIYIYIGLD